MIGETFNNRYEIQQQLGKKAGRRTLLAQDLVTSELVVVKLLAFSSDFEWNDLKLFEREAETLKSLSHPLIPKYIDYFELNLPKIKGFALVQSYIPAQTLEQYLQSGRTFTETEVKQVAKAVLEILIYLHGLHPPVIHRDIKPSNILLGERSGNSVGQVYLVDFGSVQTVLATEGGTRTVVGTYGYMPPEQFGGRTVTASDLYSLGATLIYLITGTHPADLPQKDFRIQFESVVNLSSGLTRWLKFIIEPNLERRFSSASAALQALEGSQAPINISSSLVISQPVGSKIQLTKNWDVLEIVIPPKGFSWSMLFTGAFAIAWNSFVLPWTISALLASFPLNLALLAFSLPFLAVGATLLCGIISHLFGYTRLRIDHQEIMFYDELFGFQHHRSSPSRKTSINKLVYIQKYWTRDREGNRTEVPAKLEIWAGVRKYELGVNSIIEWEAELKWLAQEISDWLDMPIQRG
ncbi:serine/threonine protein kinase [Nostoc sp. CMAA1605]|uniref:serine/threonine protein kinase n=1 Tax=Nostoc sp. CMAA1605 TaxID=2055159 RepID=UPI001F347165|nr:serine/threonine-protein kinase [Nostoc sp. CMAA1605]MCF4966753.1 serine/threonine protein kinase [Nostoc sp. CMAA1605]